MIERIHENIRTFKDIDSVKAILSKISIWGGLTDDRHDKIYKQLNVGSFRKGEYIFRKGDQPTYIYIVKNGRVNLIASDQGVAIQKESVKSGGSFWHCCFDGYATTYGDSRAAENSEIMVLSRQAILEIRYEDIELFALLMMNIARDFSKTQID